MGPRGGPCIRAKLSSISSLRAPSPLRYAATARRMFVRSPRLQLSLRPLIRHHGSGSIRYLCSRFITAGTNPTSPAAQKYKSPRRLFRLRRASPFRKSLATLKISPCAGHQLLGALLILLFEMGSALRAAVSPFPPPFREQIGNAVGRTLHLTENRPNPKRPKTSLS